MKTAEDILELMKKMPPDLYLIEQELIGNGYTKEEVTAAACRFVDMCFLECDDFEREHKRLPKAWEIHSTYVYDICKLLLNYGLDPNLIVDETNIMYELRFMDHESVTAKTMKLLLENGANPDLTDGDTALFEDIDFDIIFGLYDDKCINYDVLFYLWILLIGYGATINKGECPVKMMNGYKTEDFKNYSVFTYRISKNRDDTIMHIIDQNTDKEAAIL